MSGARGGGRAHSLEPRQAADYHGDDGILGPLGAAFVVAGDGPVLPDQLGGGLPFGGVVRAVGFGASASWRESSPLAWTRSTGAKAHGADSFLTVIYQIDSHCRRLLWVGRRANPSHLAPGFDNVGTEEVVSGLRFVCSDMWQPYLNVIAAKAGHALHVLDRFHITMHLNQAVDQVRRAESGRLRGRPLAGRLKTDALAVAAPRQRVRGHARRKLDALVASKLATARAWTLKESFQYFWHYKSYIWAGAFLDYWCSLAMRSRLEPMKKVARMLRTHEELLLNWFKAKGEISSGAVEGLNNKIRVVTRRAYGFRTFDAMEIALYHTLGRLPEPESAHRFC